MIKDRAVTAIAQRNHEIAIGSEVSLSQATISVWDGRLQMSWKSSENCDDITALQYHPSQNSVLLSGGDDGLVSLFDVTVQDEGDSLLQAFNHSPIHKAGFLSDSAIYALSSDQKLSIHPVHSFEPDHPNSFTQPVIHGDLRPMVQCDYVIDIMRVGDQAHIVAGSNLSEPHVDFIPLSTKAPFSFTEDQMIRLQGVHGEEIVRSVCADKAAGTIFTAGEDGCVKAFRASNDSGKPSLPPSPTSTKNEGKKVKAGRFRPY